MDSLTAHTGCDKASIIGLNGALWTTSTKQNALNLTPQEGAAIAEVFKNVTPLERQNVFAETGIFAEGKKYMFMRDIDDDGKVMTFTRAKVGAIILQVTEQAVICTFTAEANKHLAPSCYNNVDKIARFFKGAGY